MSGRGSLEGNKLLAALLAAGIVAMLSGLVAEEAIDPSAPDEDAYPIAEAEGGPAPAEAEEAPPLERGEIIALVAAADSERGAMVARRCVSCHAFEEGGADRIGPALWAVVGAPLGARDGFAYSPALLERAAAGAAWDYESLWLFLERPRAWLPGTKMSFAGLSKEADRAAIIAWMRTLAPSPAPLE